MFSIVNAFIFSHLMRHFIIANRFTFLDFMIPLRDRIGRFTVRFFIIFYILKDPKECNDYVYEQESAIKGFTLNYKH